MTQEAKFFPRETAKHPESNNQRLVVGIWLMIMTHQGKLFVVENNAARYISQKVPGQLNSPAETFEKTDITFAGTIRKAIREEVGTLDYNPNLVKPLGITKLNIPGSKVAAIPYLVPIDDVSCLKFQPKDREEASNYFWIEPDEILKNPKAKFGPYEVPLFRTPMLEIIQLLLDRLNGDLLQIKLSTVSPLGQDIYGYLKNNPGTRAIPK